MLNHWRWVKGRQGTGYERLTIFQSQLLKCDLHILRMSPGIIIPPHKDNIAPHLLKQGYKKHFRFNVVLKKAIGGNFVTSALGLVKKRWALFRPDIDLHWVTPVHSGTRYVLSMGWLTK